MKIKLDRLSRGFASESPSASDVQMRATERGATKPHFVADFKKGPNDVSVLHQEKGLALKCWKFLSEMHDRQDCPKECDRIASVEGKKDSLCGIRDYALLP